MSAVGTMRPWPLTWFSTVVDCRDPQALAGFWCQVLG
jgi:hypothetical protein